MTRFIVAYIVEADDIHEARNQMERLVRQRWPYAYTRKAGGQE